LLKQGLNFDSTSGDFHFHFLSLHAFSDLDVLQLQMQLLTFPSLIELIKWLLYSYSVLENIYR